ncbi:translation initiation factor IF-2 [Lusitaniella coriacea]|uniref:translation initiation factor IF-2 n=1 Tax=Lusitaniella coriacea TaxID=1983105 RepID=UPI003CF1C1C9
MNNGKTRIYELSKELNRDNKDILEICERLNIAVKSHSSTITDAQVERIRAEAKRYPASKNHGSSSAATEAKKPSSVKAKRPSGSRKPQIREILKSNDPRSSRDSQTGGKATTLATPPRPPVKPQIVSPSAASTPPEVAQPSDNSESSSETNLTQISKTQPQTLVTEREEVDSPQLLSPPPRPSKGKPPLSREDRPTIKKPKKKSQITASDKGEASSEVVGTPSGLTTNKPQPPRKPILSPPPRPNNAGKPAVADSSDLEQEDGASEENGTIELAEKPKLKRPTPPRQSKRKDWEEEEEEDKDIKGKSGKVSKVSKSGSKTKRRSQQVVFEDDDFDSESSDRTASPTAASLSVARPPKPPSLSRATAPSGSSPSKVKRPTPKGEGSSGRNDRQDRRRGEKKPVAPNVPELIELPESLTLRELADLLNTPETEIITKLFIKGIAVNITQTIDRNTAKVVAEELGVAVEIPETKSAATKTTEMLDEADLESLQRRPPVVTIMGHVDHGKTTLLDSIRKTKVAQGEAGGITQHIGAYHVDVEHNGKDEQIVFLDTPGHEAFTAMRARGTRVTDIAILVVAADDGVQPQTKEAISHAKAAGVPIVVAINKIDKAEAEPDRIKQELTEQELISEEWGGDTIMVPVSAINGENLDSLLEMILLVAEVEQLEANPNRLAKGTVIEANLDKAKGPVATLLVQNGTLRVGDSIVAGSAFGKIRAMIGDRGDRVEVASPSFAVEILGLNDIPGAGDEFEVFDSEKVARTTADKRAATQRESRLQRAMTSRRVTLSSLSAQAQEGELKELNLVIKTDVQGSLEAILSSLQQLPQNEVQIRIIYASPGEVTETDVDLAAASGAIVVGFNTALASGARQAADREGVDINEYTIIYNLLDEIQAAMEGLLEPEQVEEPLGTVEVRAVFPVGKGSVAGCYVLSGKVVRNKRMRVRRGKEIVYEGTVDSLKRMKENEQEVKTGFECGIGASKFSDWKVGDIIEAYQMAFKRRTLSAN